jgi:RNA polymerase sigma-32 factor
MNTTAPAAVASLALRDPWAMVPSLGNLDAYISAVNRVPMLSAEEEMSLARRLCAEGDPSSSRWRASTSATDCRMAT